MSNLTKYAIAVSADPRVYAVFERKLEGCDQDKVDKVLALVHNLLNEGKSLHRAMADALESFRLV